MPLPSGERLGPYEILAPLGAGGMGEVYRARDTRLGRDVAVKVLPGELASDADRLGRFEREARAAAALEHPAILNVHDVGTDDGRPYVVSELLEGETLRERLGQGRLATRKAIEIGTQIASGLAAAHDKGIVHRDLKPENVFLTGDGRVKILDFGLARLTRPEESGASATDSPTKTRLTDPGSVVGTAGYMSPEQVRGRSVDHRSDLFAFGVVLYEMLTGRRAFQGPSSVETMNAILKEDPLDGVEPGAVTPALERIVRHCLEKNPGERFQSAHDLAFDLQALSGASGESRIRAPLGQPRRRVLVALAALVALSAAGALGYLGGRRTGTPPLDFRALTFRGGSVSTARFSPDGRTVFYTAKWGEKVGLFAAAVDSPEPRPIEPVGQLVGTAAGEIAVLVPGDAGQTLVRIPVGGGAPREVLGGIEIADWARNGEFAIVRQQGGLQRLEFPPGRTLHSTENVIEGVSVSPSGRFVALREGIRDYSRKWIVLIEATGRPVFRVGPWEGASRPVWPPGEREIWAGGFRSGQSGLWAISLGGKERIVYRAPEALSVFDVTTDGRTLISSGYTRTEMAALPPGETLERDITWLGRSLVTDLSPDGRTVLFEDGGFAKGIPHLFLGPTDGRAPVQLAPGTPMTLSPDGRSVLGLSLTDDLKGPRALQIIPTGAGDTRALPFGAIASYNDAFWFPDGRRILIRAYEKGRPLRLFVQDLAGGTPRAITPEGISTDHPTIAPDGEAVLAGDLDPRALYRLYPVAGGEPRSVPGLSEGDVPLRFDRDGRYLFVREPTPLDRARALIARVDLRTGKRDAWKDLRPADPAGVQELLPWIRLADDGRAYAYSYERETSNLYLVDGLR